jgi:hypothetical protein
LKLLLQKKYERTFLIQSQKLDIQEEATFAQHMLCVQKRSPEATRLVLNGTKITRSLTDCAPQLISLNQILLTPQIGLLYQVQHLLLLPSPVMALLVLLGYLLPESLNTFPLSCFR